MGFFGAMGKALKAPLKPINKAVGAIPGMGAIQKATPGMGAMARNTGIGIQPQGPGVGPSNPMLSKFGMLGQQMGQSAPPIQAPPPDMPSPDVMPPSGVEAPIPQMPQQGPPMGQGLAPRPSGFMQAMQRRNPQFRGRM